MLLELCHLGPLHELSELGPPFGATQCVPSTEDDSDPQELHRRVLPESEWRQFPVKDQTKHRGHGTPQHRATTAGARTDHAASLASGASSETTSGPGAHGEV